MLLLDFKTLRSKELRFFMVELAFRPDVTLCKGHAITPPLYFLHYKPICIYLHLLL